MLDLAFMFCAGVGGAIMLVQFALTLLGLGDDGGGDFDLEGDAGGDIGDIDADVDVDGDHHTSLSQAADADIDGPGSMRLFEIVSLRGIVAALTFFGLTGMWARASDMSPMPSMALGAVAGVAAMYGVYWTMQQLYKLRSSGTANILNAPGQTATIYVPVPAKGEGRGKVHVTLQGRTMEYEAVTENDERLETGASVLITSVVGSDLVRVERLKEAATQVSV